MKLTTWLEEQGKSRGEYFKLILTEKATIGKYASDHGMASAIREIKENNLKESSIRDWQDTYLKDYKEKL